MQTPASTPSSHKHLPDVEAGYSPGGTRDVLAVAIGEGRISLCEHGEQQGFCWHGQCRELSLPFFPSL